MVDSPWNTLYELIRPSKLSKNAHSKNAADQRTNWWLVIQFSVADKVKHAPLGYNYGTIK